MEQFSLLVDGFHILGIGITKISMCLTLLRIVELAKPRTVQFLWSLLIFVGITHFGLGMIYFLACRPLSAFGDPQSRASCLPVHTINWASCIIWSMDAATDLICAAIPILILQRLQMDMRTKLALCGLMSLGVFTAGCAVAKTISLQKVTPDNFTWELNTLTIWAATEQCLGIIITSIPMLRPLFSNSHKSLYSWFRMRFSTQILPPWGKNRSRSGSSPLVRSQPKQHMAGPDVNLRDVEKNPTPPGSCHGHIQVDRNYTTYSVHSIVTYEEYTRENIPDDLKGITPSLPNISDQTPGVFSVPATLA